MQTMKDGSSKPLFDNQVINIGNNTRRLASFHLPLSGAEGFGHGRVRSRRSRPGHRVVR